MELFDFLTYSGYNVNKHTIVSDEETRPDFPKIAVYLMTLLNRNRTEYVNDIFWIIMQETVLENHLKDMYNNNETTFEEFNERIPNSIETYSWGTDNMKRCLNISFLIMSREIKEIAELN